MKILRADFRSYALPLRAPLRTARGELRVRRGLLLRLETRGGFVGWGEAAPLPGHAEESLGEASFAMGQALALLQAADVPSRAAALPEFLLETLHLPLGIGAIPPTVAFAVELALLDLLARRARCPLSELLSPEAAPAVPLSRLVPGPDEARRAVEEGLRSVKIKLSGGPLPEQLARVAATRAAIGPEVELRVDANQQWGAEEAAEALAGLAAHQVAYVEEPLRDPSPEGLAALRGLGAPLAADESLRGPQDLERLIEAEAVDVVVLKPAFLGGPLVSLSMARAAAKAGLGVLVTSALDGAIGRRGALHVAAAVPPAALRPCGLDTGGLLAQDLADEPARQGAMMPVGRGAGLGLDARW
ncbi:MAG: o-succinylbenzoate synthase [Alphaproteobacteria bacterium]|nr:o-succinylbenzoate synthase [Alphaproteobacteria bacterium]